MPSHSQREIVCRLAVLCFTGLVGACGIDPFQYVPGLAGSASAKASASLSVSASASSAPKRIRTKPPASAVASASGSGSNKAPVVASSPPRTPEGFPEEIPFERTALPTTQEWIRAPRLTTTPDAPKGCDVRVINEWVKFRCAHDTGTVVPKRLMKTIGWGTSAADVVKKEIDGVVVDLTARMIEGKKASGIILSDKGTINFGYEWVPEAVTPKVYMDRPIPVAEQIKEPCK